MSNILISESLLLGSLYPYGPYIGLPSYAQPIIGECFTPSSPNVSFPIWVEYPTIEYFNVPSDSTNASLPYLSNEFVYKLLILVSNLHSLPRLVTIIDILSSS